MSKAPHCHHTGCCAPTGPARSAAYRRVLLAALAINALMFFVEIAAGWRAASASLLADALDFAGDAANYGLSLAVLSAAAAWRARAALVKAASMAAFGVAVLARTAWLAWSATLPEAATMGAVGSLALLANLAVAAMLYAWREGDANMRSVWLCTRNDALGNLAVVLAALGVFGSGRAWPDLAVAAIMAALAVSAATAVARQARAELRVGASTNGRIIAP
ncbi:cation transporter [Caldimonas sp. KR1-144]|uniref:cation transporter n=1 Tax=Caldimonas sp. KR1-144 TaxID=3400911 RepID=UPI003BFAB465